MQAALAAALLLASSAAAALGLGQIELKSRLGEPLLAEIPIISNDPAELRQLEAGLASPETFARVGLEPPDQVVANLRFTSALDERGNPVIRVTSTRPITQPLLTFLIEVDWGQGRLVREYSALLDTPRTVAAPLQPPIQAPRGAPSNAIVREPAAPPIPAEPAAPPQPERVQPEPVQPEPAQPEQPQPEPAAPAPVATEPTRDRTVPATPAPAPSPPPAAPAEPVSPMPAQPSGVPQSYGEVRRGETLSEIASSLDLQVSLDQAMIALLRANPQAFIDSNINLLRQGAVLRVPDREELAAIDAVQASALVRSQVRQWRQARQAVPQPVAAAGAVADGTSRADADGGNGDARATPAAGARLEIVPPGASDASEAGTQSGIAAGGEGDMQRELATTKETLAAREAELAEMKSRVAELEQLQDKQQQLLEMKDTELAAVQQRLAQAQQDDGAAGAAALPWVLGGAGVLLLALLAGWWLRRRAKTPEFRQPRAGAIRRTSVADAFTPAAPAHRDRPDSGADANADAGAGPSQAPVAAVENPPAPPKPDPVDAAPEVDAGPAPGAGPVPAANADAGADTREAPRPSRDQRERPPLPGTRAPTWHQDGAQDAGAPAPAASGMADAMPTADASSQERLELARAYMDLGDRDSARQLLDEVAGNGDAAARQHAARMLRELE